MACFDGFASSMQTQSFERHQGASRDMRPCYSSGLANKTRLSRRARFHTIGQEGKMLPRPERGMLRLAIALPSMLLLIAGLTGHAAAESLYDKIKRVGVF